MTTDQTKYYDFLIKQFNDHNHDMVSTLGYVTRHRLPRDVQLANRNLSIEERNEVVKTVCMLGA